MVFFLRRISSQHPVTKTGQKGLVTDQPFSCCLAHFNSNSFVAVTIIKSFI